MSKTNTHLKTANASTDYSSVYIMQASLNDAKIFQSRLKNLSSTHGIDVLPNCSASHKQT